MGRIVRRQALLAVVLALVGTAAALGAIHATATVKSAKNKTLNTTIVVSASGRTLYHLTTEKGKTFACTGSCASIWPPATIAKGAKLTAGLGINKSKLATIKRPDGRIQVTYYGMTLYRYSGDSNAGQTSGEGIQNIWYVVGANGKLVKTTASSGGYGGR